MLITILTESDPIYNIAYKDCSELTLVLLPTIQIIEVCTFMLNRTDPIIMNMEFHEYY